VGADRNPALAGWWLTAALLLLPPLIQGGTPRLPSFVVNLGILLLVVFWSGIWARAPRRELRLSALDALLGFLLFWSLFSTLFAPYYHPAESASLAIACSIALYAYLSFNPSFAGLAVALGAVRAQAGFQSLLVLGEAIGFGRHRPAGTFFNPNFLAGFLAAATDGMIKATLMRGREGTPMVSFIKQGLKERDINDIVRYVRSFEKEALSASAQILQVESPVIIRHSPYDLATTVENVKRAVNNNNFFHGRVQTLENGLTPPENENPKQVIVYFCNISLLNQALAVDPRVGMFLPCRITIVEKEGKVQLMSVNPKVMSRLFNNSELNQMCEQLEQSYIAIMEEATL